jgi:hypothetical protein
VISRAVVLGALTMLLAGTTLGASAGSAARAEPGGARVIDRTYRCAVFFRGGTYLLDSRAHAGTRVGAGWARLPYAGIRSGVFSSEAGNLVAWVTSGKPTPTSMIDQDYDAFPVRTYGTLGIRREACREVATRIPLSSAGLRGGPAPPLGDRYQCFSPRQVLVRVRAVFATPAVLRRGQAFLATHVPVREAKLAARTLTGKPLVYADVVESGKARLFAARGCSVG